MDKIFLGKAYRIRGKIPKIKSFRNGQRERKAHLCVCVCETLHHPGACSGRLREETVKLDQLEPKVVCIEFF